MPQLLTVVIANQRFFIPRIPLCPKTNILPIKFTRLQFPVRPAFAMTINKSQGQHIRSDGIVFTKHQYSFMDN